MDFSGDGVNSASTSAALGTPPPLAAAPKILSRNCNATLVLTTTPNNEAELQLYRVMQRASLLAYYDTLLEMGGDDVQQLCEAGEEEFLEIMALVGMASKPLHVRRLQKALQEWLVNPAMFQSPLLPGEFTSRVMPPAAPCGAPPSPNQSCPSPAPCKLEPLPSHCTQSVSPNTTQGLGCELPSSAGSPGRGPASSTSPGPSPSPGSPLQLTPTLVPAQISRLADAAQNLLRSLPHLQLKANNTKKKACKDLENVLAMAEDDPLRMEQIRKYAAIYGRFDCKRKPEKPLTLHEVSVNEAAAQICRLVPALLTRRDELFPLARQAVRDSGYHYSKGHSKSYTVSQGTRSMVGYSNGDHKRARLDLPQSLAELSDEALRLRRQERLEQIAEELRSVSERTEELLAGVGAGGAAAGAVHIHVEALQGRHTQLLLEQSELIKQNQTFSSLRYYQRSGSGCGRVSSSYDSERPDTDDTDSQLSFSNASSPSQEIGDSRDSLSLTREAEAADQKSPNTVKQNESDDELLAVVPSKPEPQQFDDPYFHENKVQVIASSGGNIIAVANPALSMSPAIADSVLLKKEALSPKLSL